MKNLKMRNAKRSAILAAIAGVAATHAYAQSSVTLYGVLDDSIQYIHNTSNATGGNANFIGLAAGNLQGNRFGLKGAEDLGGGLKAIFQLENGFNPNTGKMGSYPTGTKLFGRQAYMGLSSDTFGTVTLGRQYDPVVDLIQPLTADNYWGSTFTTPGDVDNNDNSSRTNNAVKYSSPNYAGLQFEAMYGLGGVAGSTGSGQTWSTAATYAYGPLSVAGGYIMMDNADTLAGRGYVAATATMPAVVQGWGSGVTSDGTFDSQINSMFASAKSVGIGSLAAQFVTGPFTMGVRYSNAQYKPDAMSTFAATQRYQVGAGFVNYQLTPAAMIGLGYNLTHGVGNMSQTYNQISLGADYNLSKRTDVYLVGAYQRANSGQSASVADYGYSSNAQTQDIVSLGLRHKF
jgi:predicted porin